MGVNLLQEVIERLKGNYRANFQNHALDNLGIIFTKISKTPRKGVKKNIEEIKDAFSDEEMPFFENKYLKWLSEFQRHNYPRLLLIEKMKY